MNSTVDPTEGTTSFTHESNEVELKVHYNGKMYRFENKLLSPVYSDIPDENVPINSEKYKDIVIQADELPFKVNVIRGRTPTEFKPLNVAKNEFSFFGNSYLENTIVEFDELDSFIDCQTKYGYLPLFLEILDEEALKAPPLFYIRLSGYKINPIPNSFVFLTNVVSFDLVNLFGDMEKCFDESYADKATFTCRLRSLRYRLHQFFSKEYASRISEINPNPLFTKSIRLYLEELYTNFVKKYVGTQIILHVPEHKQRNILADMAMLRELIAEEDDMDINKTHKADLKDLLDFWRPITTMRAASKQHLSTVSTMSFDEIFISLENLKDILNEIVSTTLDKKLFVDSSIN